MNGSERLWKKEVKVWSIRAKDRKAENMAEDHKLSIIFYQ
jgi:hypothetical protein